MDGKGHFSQIYRNFAAKMMRNTLFAKPQRSLLQLTRRWHSAIWAQSLALMGIVVGWTISPLGAWAQQDASYLQYWKIPTQWNPAAAGRSPQLNINTALQTHALGFEDAGSTMWAGADMAFAIGRTRHGVGAAFTNDAIGLFSHKRLAVQYAYHRRLWGGTLSLGLQADMLQEDIDGSKAQFGSGSDPAFPSSKINGSAFDGSAGLFFQRKALQLGIAVQHISAPVITYGETHQLEVRRHYNVMAAYNIRTGSPLFTIIPSAMWRSDLVEHRIDLTLRGNYAFEKRTIYGGINYAPQRSIALFAGGTLYGIDLTYSYEANTSGLGLGAGQHEVGLTYRLDLDLGKKGKNLHKSVRWL